MSSPYSPYQTSSPPETVQASESVPAQASKPLTTAAMVMAFIAFFLALAAAGLCIYLALDKTTNEWDDYSSSIRDIATGGTGVVLSSMPGIGKWALEYERADGPYTISRYTLTDSVEAFSGTSTERYAYLDFCTFVSPDVEVDKVQVSSILGPMDGVYNHPGRNTVSGVLMNTVFAQEDVQLSLRNSAAKDLTAKVTMSRVDDVWPYDVRREYWLTAHGLSADASWKRADDSKCEGDSYSVVCLEPGGTEKTCMRTNLQLAVDRGFGDSFLLPGATKGSYTTATQQPLYLYAGATIQIRWKAMNLACQ